MDKYYVAQITLTTGQGWTSIHTSNDGAEKALIDWAAGAKVNRGIPVATIDNFDLCLEDTGTPAVESWGIWHLPVQP